MSAGWVVRFTTAATTIDLGEDRTVPSRPAPKKRAAAVNPPRPVTRCPVSWKTGCLPDEGDRLVDGDLHRERAHVIVPLVAVHDPDEQPGRAVWHAELLHHAAAGARLAVPDEERLLVLDVVV